MLNIVKAFQGASNIKGERQSKFYLGRVIQQLYRQHKSNKLYSWL